jgi:hypothetical protein
MPQFQSLVPNALIREGAGWAIQMIDLSYKKLKAAASQVDPTLATYPTSLATEMFACCWSIIDQCHMLRKILEREDCNLERKQAGSRQRAVTRFTWLRHRRDVRLWPTGPSRIGSRVPACNAARLSTTA